MTKAPYTGYAVAESIGVYLEQSRESVLGRLADHAARRPWGSTEHQQVAAWTDSAHWLTAMAKELIDRVPQTAGWTLCLEYEIPRRGGRIDAVLLADDLIFVIEFKSQTLGLAARRQAEDYALELRDFHAGSAGRLLFPIACAEGAELYVGAMETEQLVAQVSTGAPVHLSDLVLSIWSSPDRDRGTAIAADSWLKAPYRPIPTILEAAAALYAGHSVRELSQSEASAEHLKRTYDGVARAVDTSRLGRRVIVFVTGTPGAGKTLAGLNVVHGLKEIRAAFLSGNRPLVTVLQHILAHDLALREGCTRAEGMRRAKTLVTNVHLWIDEYVDRSPDLAPYEDVIVFDEAQRAWNREHSYRKFGRDRSEPEMMLGAMSRRDQAVIVGLVGGGQEIHTGEAGLAEWGRALLAGYQDWEIVVSSELASGSPEAGTALFECQEDIPRDRVRLDDDLHLAVSQRSFRTRKLTEWVEAVLGNEPDQASILMEHLFRYPIVMTRDLDLAKDWVRRQTRGLRRCGLLASSGARRLRPHGISVQERIEEAKWFLKPPEDVRSSNFLELAISEFGIQGLEVDWACLAWGGDFTRRTTTWRIRAFRGTSWQEVRNSDARAYAVNRYRVLLTRAREGMVLWIPPGDERDGTRNPLRYDSVAEYLSRCGVKTIGG